MIIKPIFSNAFSKEVYPSADLVKKIFPNASLSNIKANLPFILHAMAKRNMTSVRQLIGVLATIAVEVPSFRPIEEYGRGGGKHANYFGRGYVQLTWRNNYRLFSAYYGVDAVNNPELLLRPEIAAEALVWYWTGGAGTADIRPYAEKSGLHTNEGFIPADKLKKREDAMFYIHLLSEDYKTGKVYGEFWGKIPNMTFKDGSSFYDYINDWIYGKWRKVILGDKQHQLVFISPNLAKPLDKDSLGSMIKHIFLSKTGIAIFPHKLRKIFCTYLDRIDASPKIRKSVARWMHHSEEMARKVYTVTDLQNELSAGFDFMTELNQKL